MVRLPESARSVEGLGQILIETPNGRIPLSKIATIEDGDGPNQISRDDGKRRIVLSANASGRALSEIVADIRKVVAETKLPEGYFITLGGQFQAQEEASRLVGPAVHRVADADVRGAVQPLPSRRRCRR